MLNVNENNLIEETTSTIKNELFGINDLIVSYVNAETAQAAANLSQFFELVKLYYTDNSFKNRPAVATDGRSIKPCCYIRIIMSDKTIEVLDRQAKKITLGENSAMADKKIAYTVLENENFANLQEKFTAAAMNIEDIRRDDGSLEYLIYPDMLMDEIDDVKAKITAAYELKVAEKQRALDARCNRMRQEIEEEATEE